MIQFKKDPSDNLKNRRTLAVIAFFFVLLWPCLILWIFLQYPEMDTTAAALFLAVPEAVGASPILAYWLAAHKDDQK